MYLRKYNASTTIDFELFEVDGVDLRVDAVAAVGDAKIMKDEGAEANTTNAFEDKGQGYSIVLNATEMAAARVVIYIVDQTATKVWLDRTLIIETYGNASAQHAFDLDNTLNDSTIADQVWDEVLTGATHNVTNSAGRRLRNLQEFQGYALGAIWIDTVNGTAGTSDFENGTVNNPVLTLADAITLASSLNLKRFVVTPGSSITFAEAHTSEIWAGTGWTLALGGQDISDSEFRNAIVSGTGTTPTGDAHFEHCEIGTCTLGQAHLDNCDIEGTVTLSATATYQFIQCIHAGTSTIDFGAAVASTTVHIHGWEGALIIDNMGQSGTDILHFTSSGGKLTLNASNTGGTVNLNGTFDLVDSGSGQTINQAGRVNNDVAAIQTDLDNTTDGLGALATLINALNDLSAAQVNTEMVDVIKTDTLTATAQAAPSTTPTLEAAVMTIYDALIHKIDIDSGFKEFYNNAGTLIWKKALSDDASNYVEAESETGA